MRPNFNNSSQQEKEDDELIDKMLKGSRSAKQFESLVSVKMIEFDMFLRFKTKELTDDYIAFKNQNKNNPLSIFVALNAICFLLLRGAIFNDVKALVKGNPVFDIYNIYIQKILLTFIVILMCYFYAPNQMVFLKRWNVPYAGILFQHTQDIAFMFGGIVPSIRLIGRVVQGTCAPGTSVWHSQVCNTNGAMNEIPIDSLLAVATYSLAAQMILRFPTPNALFATWVVNISILNVALYIVESPLVLCMNILLLILSLTSYEVERMTIQFYVNQKFALESAEANAKLKLELISAQMKEEKRLIDSKREMVRHIAHEIRTPLNIVAVATDIILAELNRIDSVPQFVYDTLNSCQEACAISIDIVNDLLNFEKLAAGLVTLEKMPMVLSTYVQRVLNPFYVSAGAKDITLDYQYVLQDVVVDNPENVEDVVEIDSVKMSSVLRNLLSNAIKFAKETIIVKVSVDRKLAELNDDQACLSGQAIISVKDDGAGISSGNLSRLFQEGVQFNANELQKGGGSGFGLYIAKGIVDLHTDSRMWAESEGEGKGATFFVKLPLSNVVIPSAPHRQSLMSDSVVAVANATLLPLVILVVDDSPMNRRLTIQLLKQICRDTHTCTFLEADDGQEAVSTVMQSLVAPMLHFAHYRPAVQPRGDQSPKPGSLLGSGSRPNSAAGSHNPSRRNSFNKHMLSEESPDATLRLVTSRPPTTTVKGMRSLDNSRSRGIHGLDTSVTGGGLRRRLNTSGKDGLTAADLAERRDPTIQIDIVFMDYNMPRMTGPVATAEMRRWGYTGPIIGVSGDTDISAFLEAGANAALVKPINKVQMEGVLHQHVPSWNSDMRMQI